MSQEPQGKDSQLHRAAEIVEEQDTSISTLDNEAMTGLAIPPQARALVADCLQDRGLDILRAVEARTYKATRAQRRS